MYTQGHRSTVAFAVLDAALVPAGRLSTPSKADSWPIRASTLTCSSFAWHPHVVSDGPHLFVTSQPLNNAPPACLRMVFFHAYTLNPSCPRGSIYTTIMESGPKTPDGDGLLGPKSTIVVYTWTLKVCRIIAFNRFWAIILPTFGGSGMDPLGNVGVLRRRVHELQTACGDPSRSPKPYIPKP